MPWFWARVHDRTQQLGYLRGGFQQLYFGLSDAIRQAGGETRYGTAVTSVRTDGDAPPRRDRCRRRALRPRRLDPGDAADRAARARAAAGVAGSPRVGPRLRRALHDPRPGSAADIGLLAQHERSGLPVHGPRGAHELPAARRLRRPPPHLPRQLPADGRPADDRLTRRRPRRVPAAPGAPEPGRSIAPG